MQSALNQFVSPWASSTERADLELVLLRERQGAQQMAAVDRNVALGKALQEDLRAPRLLIEERRRGGEQQDVAIARLRAHGFFGLR